MSKASIPNVLAEIQPRGLCGASHIMTQREKIGNGGFSKLLNWIEKNNKCLMK